MRRTGILSFALSLLLLPFGLPGAYGQAVLERRVMSTASPVRTADTYHVYDALGRLVAEVPPELAASLSTGAVSQTSVNKYAFLYLYDDLGGTLERTLDYGPYGESLGTDWAATSAPAARKLFIGKEKLKSDDTELYDFGARRYDPALPRWTSADPLAGKYPGISPYVYCAGNPVCVVDPNGEAWYIIDIEGYITKIDNRKGEQFDILFKMSDNGSIDSRGLKIYNQTILSELEKNSETPLLPSYSDLKEVFFFVADNSNVEWGLYSSMDGNILRTDHGTLEVSEPSSFTGRTVEKIHSHPETKATTKDEYDTMGFLLSKDNYDSMGNLILGKKPVKECEAGDWRKYINDYFLRGDKAAISKVYFPQSRRIYQIRLHQRPLLISTR